MACSRTFSSAVSARSRLGCWKTMPIWLRTSLGLAALRRSRRCVTRPEVGARVVVRIEIVVVLPAPFGPSRAKNSPGATVKLIPSTALVADLR